MGPAARARLRWPTAAMLLAALAAATHCGSRHNGADASGADGGPGALSFGEGGAGSGADASGAEVAPEVVTVLGPGVTAADVGRVEALTPVADQAPRTDYPLAGAIMPRTAYAPKVMWTPQHPAPQAADVYRVRLDRGVRRVEGYFLNAAGFSNAWQLPDDAWPVVGSVSFEQPIGLTVAVLSGGVLRQGPPLEFRTVSAFLRGSVYYWSPPEQRIKRVDVDKGTVTDFLPNPGAPCVGCHGLSRDGRKLALQRDTGQGKGQSYVSFDLTRDLTGNPAPTLLDTPSDYGDVSLGYNADATRLVFGGTGQTRDFHPLRLIDAKAGTLLRTSTTAMGLDPEWSPDNTAVAYTAKGTGGDDLTVVPIASDDFGTPALVHSGASGADGTIDWHPTWSPDSQWLAFQNGVGSTAGGDSTKGRPATEPGAIWLAPRAGGKATRLDKLNGGTAATSYRPFFTPFDSGGYFWLLLTSTRTYGNASAGVSGQKQVWIAAVADKPTGSTTDASEVPYYLAGQETTNPIISPQWAPSPCRTNGDTCTTANDCCSGGCNASTCGAPAQCVSAGGSCDVSADCCAPLACSAHVCDSVSVR